MKRIQTLGVAIAAVLVTGMAASPAFADARVRVAHFATLEGREDLTVSIAIDGEAVADVDSFGEFSEYQNLAAGTYEVTVTPTDEAEAVITEEVTVVDDQDYTIAAIGSGGAQPLELLTLEDDNTAAADGNLRLRIVHAAPFSDTEESTAVSIRSDDGMLIGGLDNLSYGEFSDIMEVPAGTYNLKVSTPDGSTNLIDAAPVDLIAGESVTIFAVGNSIGQPLALVAIPTGTLEGETPTDDRYTGHWYDPTTPGQGLGLHPVAGQDRIFATWYTFGSDGAPVWYALDTCASPGSLECDTVGFDGDTATFSVASSTGGSFNEPGGIENEAIGEMTIEFTSCTTATATYALNGERNGTMDLVNLTPVDSCND